MATSYQQLKDLTVEDLKTNPELALTVSKLWGGGITPQTMNKYLASGYYSIGKVRGYVSGEATTEQVAHGTEESFRRYTNWNNPAIAADYKRALEEREKGLTSLGKLKSHYGAMGLDVSTIPGYQSRLTGFGAEAGGGITAQQTAQQPTPIARPEQDPLSRANLEVAKAAISETGRLDVGEGLDVPVTVVPKRPVLDALKPEAEAPGITVPELAGLGDRFGVEGIGEMPTFRTGLDETQRKNIETLIRTKPQATWSDKDWKDYEWATEAPEVAPVNTLLNYYNARPDVRIAFERRFPGQNPTIMGTEANRELNNWFENIGKAEMADEISKGTFAPTGLLGSEIMTEDLIDLTDVDFDILIDADYDKIIDPILPEDTPDVKAAKIKAIKDKADKDAEVSEKKEKYNKSANTLIEFISTMSERIAAARDEKEKEALLSEKSDAVAEAEKNFKEMETLYMQHIEEIKHGLASGHVLLARESRARGQAAIELAGLAAIVDVANNDYNRASQRVSNYMSEWKESMEWGIKASQMKLEMLGTDLSEAQQESKDAAQVEIDFYIESYNNVCKTQDQTKQLMLAYPEAKININDTWEEAYQKVSPFIKSEKDFDKRIALLSVEVKEFNLEQAEVAATIEAMGGTKTGGSRSWRNNNPGNIEYGEFAKNMGAIGTDGRFAIFPTEETGQAAMIALLKSSNYQKLTLDAAMRRWSGDGYGAEVFRGGISAAMSSLSDSDLLELSQSMRTREGWFEGDFTPISAEEPKGVVFTLEGDDKEYNLATVEGIKAASTGGMSYASVFATLDMEEPSLTSTAIKNLLAEAGLTSPIENEVEETFLSDPNLRNIAIATVKKIGVEDAVSKIQLGRVTLTDKKGKKTKITLTQDQIQAILKHIVDEYPEGKRTFWNWAIPYGR